MFFSDDSRYGQPQEEVPVEQINDGPMEELADPITAEEAKKRTRKRKKMMATEKSEKIKETLVWHILLKR